MPGVSCAWPDSNGTVVLETLGPGTSAERPNASKSREEGPAGKAVMDGSEHDQPRPLFDGLLSGDVPLDESSAVVLRTPYD